MIKNVLTVFLLVCILTVEAQVKTPAPSPFSKISQMVGLTEVSLEYSRPSMRGRTIFGNLVPYDKIWRTGANARTKITFDSDVSINGNLLKKGTYALFTKPNADNWDIYFYTDYKGGGIPQNWDEGKIALKTIVKTEPIAKPIQSFTITIDNLKDDSAVLGLYWENTYVGVQINVPTDDIASKSIADIMNGPTANDYNNAASYYRKNGKDLNQALIWITKATELNKEAFWMMREKSLIQAALGDKKNAIKSAELSLAMAKKAGNAGYIKMNTDSIAEWSK
jgi:hypothetical protein